MAIRDNRKVKYFFSIEDAKNYFANNNCFAFLLGDNSTILRYNSNSIETPGDLIIQPNGITKGRWEILPGYKQAIDFVNSFGLGGSAALFQGDANTLTKSGFYYCSSSATNVPGAGMLLSFGESSNAISQIHITRSNISPKIYYRSKDESGFSSWINTNKTPLENYFTLFSSLYANQNLQSKNHFQQVNNSLYLYKGTKNGDISDYEGPWTIGERPIKTVNNSTQYTFVDGDQYKHLVFTALAGDAIIPDGVFAESDLLEGTFKGGEVTVKSALDGSNNPLITLDYPATLTPVFAQKGLFGIKFTTANTVTLGGHQKPVE